MSSDLMFDYIIVNMIRNKKLKCHEEEVDYFLQIFMTKKIICTEGHVKTFTGRKAHTSV